MIIIATIDIKLKTYEQLQFEIIKMNTDIYLKDKEIDDLQNRLENEVATNILKCKEIERLNKEKDDLDDYNRYLHNELKKKVNIINEIEKLLNEYELGKYDYSIPIFVLKEKMNELKGEE